MTLTQTLLSFQGRIRRRDWWTWTIATTLAGVVVMQIVFSLLYDGVYSVTSANGGPIIGDPISAVVLSIVISLPFLWVQMALAAKRAHDRDNPAWIVMAITLISAVSAYVPDQTASDGQNYTPVFLAITGVILIASIYLLVVLGFMDGTPGPNRYGSSPKGVGGAQTDTVANVFE